MLELVFEEIFVDIYETGRRALRAASHKRARFIGELLVLIAPDSRYARYLRATANISLERYQIARKDFARVLEWSPEDVFALYGYAISCYLTNENSEAITSLNTMLEIAPKSDAAVLARGKILGDVEGNEEAVARYREVLKHHPEFQDIRHLLSVCLPGADGE